MQSDKIKKTRWTIHSRGESQSIELSYFELDGVIQSIKLGIRDREMNGSLTMTPSEFQKFYLVFQSFHDLLISNDMNITNSSVFHHSQPKKKMKNKELSDDVHIDIDEWDPW